MTPKIRLIVAMGQRREIGKDNKLLWDIPADMEFFRKRTTGNTVVMGRKTFESIGSKPLRGRNNIVLTRNLKNGIGLKQYNDSTVMFMSYEFFMHVFMEHYYTEEMYGNMYIIGGEEIYRKFVDIADIMYITHVGKSFPDADSFFPEFNKRDFKEITLQIGRSTEIPYAIKRYERR